MSESPPDVDDLSLDDLKKLVLRLLEENAALKAENAALREEIARLKGLKGRPKLKPSGMEQASEPAPERRAKRRRKGRRAKLVVHDERVIKAEAPAGSRFKGYQDFVVQELVIRPRVIRFRRERWLTADGQTLLAPLPAWVEGHFGPDLKRYVLAQYYQGQVTIPRLTAQLNDLGLRISKRHVVRLLSAGKDGFRDEAIGVLRAGLETARWITVDDTSARHKAANGVTTQIGNDYFTWFATTRSKSRLNFLQLLRAGHTDYVIDDAALTYMRTRALSHMVIDRLAAHERKWFPDQEAWLGHLDALGISALRVHPDPVRIATECALWGSAAAHGLLRDAVIVSDDAGQFNVDRHALCWIHGPAADLQARPGGRAGDRRLLRLAAGGGRARAGADLVVLRRPQGLSSRTRRRRQGRPQGPLRAHLPAPHRLRHPRRGPGAAARQQGRAADGARPARDPAAHQRLGERHPLPGHQAQDQRRHPLGHRA
jgi:hypothetical protein